MAGGAPRAKGPARQDWTCKSCVSKRGRAVVSWGTALKCQGCKLPRATCFGANVPLPAAAKSKSKSGAAPGGGCGKAPPWAGPPPSVHLAQAQRELADLKKQLKASGPASVGGPLGRAQAMEADVGEGAGAGSAAALAEIHMCESGLHAIEDQTADWATAPREDMRARLEKAKARLFASKPLHARTRAVANKAKQCAERLGKAEGNERKAQEALRRAVVVVERAEKVHTDLLEQRVVLQAELAQPQQQAPQAPPPRPAGQAMAQDVVGGLGITVGELEAVVLQQLSAHPNEEQTVPAEAQKRMAGVPGVRIAELSMSKRARREEVSAEEQASASQQERRVMAQSGKGSPSQRPRQQRLEAAAAQPLCRAGSLRRSRWSSSGSGCGSIAWSPKAARSQTRAPAALRLQAGASSLTRILLILSTRFGAMAKGSIFAASATEHHARDRDRLAALQQAVLDHVPAGLWAPAVQGPRGEAGAPGGVAVLARSHVIVTSPPFLESPVLLAGRLVAAHVHWGVAGGFVSISAYFHDSVGWNADNQHVAAVLMKYLSKLSAAGIDWVVGGDFAKEPGKFPAQQLHGVRGPWAAAEDATCRPRAGAWSALDYVLFAANPAPRLCRPRVDEYGATRPRLPVAMEMRAQGLPMQARVVGGPRPIGPAPPVGCSRGVEDWRKPLAQVRAAVSREHLPEARGAVVATVEQELLDRYDVVGHDRTKCVGRSGALETTLVAVKWRPPRRRTALGRQAAACRVASRWARHLMGVGEYVAKAVRQLHGASLLCLLFEAQFDKLAGGPTRGGGVPRQNHRQPRRAGAPAALGAGQDFFGQRMLMFAQADFAGQASSVVEYANDHYEAALAATRKEWAKWANAHRPADLEEWDALPELTVDKMKRAALSFPTGTAMGPVKIGMRALSFLSEDGMYVWAQLFVRMEKLGAWSSSDATFDLNLETEIAVALEEQVATVPLDAWKIFETVIPEALIQGARLHQMPLPLAWLVVELYRQPRRLQAFGSASYDVVSYRGVLAGCAHARALASVPMHRVLERASCMGVTPRALVDDVALQWERTAGSNVGVLWAAVTRFRVWKHAVSHGLQRLHWARNLGHDPGGGWIQRRRAKLRLKALARRRGRPAALKRAAGRKVTVLRRTGLLPSAGHGAGVVGISDDEFQRLRAEASQPAGGGAAGPVGRDDLPGHAAQREVLQLRLGAEDIVGQKLTLWRIGWYMWSSLVLVTSEKQHISLLTTSPSDLKAYFVEGVSSWQGRQIPSHFGGARPTGPIWMRALRLCAGGKGAAVAEGPAAASLGVHWAGAPWTRQGQLGVRVAPDGSCLACGAEADALGRRPCDCEALLRARQASPPGGSELGTACFVANRSSVEQEQDAPPDRLQQRWATMRDKGLQAGGAGVADFSGFAREVGPPALPLRVPPAADEAEVRPRGDWSGASDEQRGNIAFTDGSGFANSMPELRRCGWSLVQLGSNGVDKLLGQQARLVAADLLALAQVFWIPARQDVDGHLASGLRPALYAGNLWADWCAEQGTLQRAVPQVHAELYAIEAQCFTQVADYIASEARYVPAAPPPPVPKLTVVEHPLARVRGRRGMSRAESGRRPRAETGAAAQQFVRSSCLPAPLARLTEAADAPHLGAGPYWMGDAEGLGAEARQRCDGGRPCKLAQRPNPCFREGDGGGAALHLGHRLRRAGPAIFREACCGLPTDKGHHQRSYVSNLAARRDKLLRGLDPETGRSWATGTLVHDERSPGDDSFEEGTDEAVVAHGCAEAPLAVVLGTATRGSPAAPCGGRTKEAQKAGVQETATRGAPAELRGGRTEEAPLADVKGTATRGAPVPPRGGRTEAGRRLAEERLEVLRRRVATREAGLAGAAAGGAGSAPTAQVVEALTDTGCAVGDRAGSWAVRRQALLRRLQARAERLCGGAGAAPREAPAGFAARLRRRGIRVAQPPPRAALPQRPPRPLALERRLDRWGRWWIEPLLDADGAANDWLDHCVPYAEAILAEPTWRRFIRAMGSTAQQLAEAWCRREWRRGARLRSACAKYRSGLTLSQRCVADSTRRYEVYCLRSWLAARAGLPPTLGWARA
ncbi:unnamed protein product, partial [Prorocentrum cordatum]